ncbi:hypothetical protein M3B11_07000 [Brevibacterium sp. p3-SID960]|uniref:hypothetical protein n=1 Tax=Brevibacterium sp. p3-SID960 TaxID=2916063 RepID=UPI0021A6D803|nr:hypothetical protein [Brevibacterium sp. p3-SID960]MCT1690701.1 hypothetical protein [Brevibacterium sp. p3-SID960]
MPNGTQKPGTVRVPTDMFSPDTGEMLPTELEGRSVHYQLGFSGSPVPQLTGDGVSIGEVQISQSDEPFHYQYTDVVIFGESDFYESETTRKLWSRPGQFITIASTQFDLERERSDIQVREARELCESALGALCAVLDERFLDRRIGEFMVVDSGEGAIALDVTSAVRTFQPGIGRIGLEELQSSATGFTGDPILSSALKFYTRGVENRLTEVGYVILSATLDMLSGGRNRLNPVDIRAALDKASARDWGSNHVKKVVRVRNELIHTGMIPSADMFEAWYDLEEMVRTLLRHRMRVSSKWDVRVPMYEGPVNLFATQVDEEDVPEDGRYQQ